MSARAWIGWIAGTLAVAVMVHVASVWLLPHGIMHIALSRMGSKNTIHHQERVTALSRGVVRPSPDLLYSVCPFDLSKGPLIVRAAVPQGTYWSVSIFDTNTDNIFALNDRHAKQRVVLIILPPKTTKFGMAQIADPNAPPVMPYPVVSSTMRGLVLFRTLINDEKNFARIDAVRRQATCAPLGR
jgi:uncharacterized membrane protein